VTEINSLKITVLLIGYKVSSIKNLTQSLDLEINLEHKSLSFGFDIISHMS